MLDALPGTDEYRKAKVEFDVKSQEKWLYYGQLGAVERILKLISDKEERQTRNGFSHYHCKAVGAEELPF